MNFWYGISTRLTSCYTGTADVVAMARDLAVWAPAVAAGPASKVKAVRQSRMRRMDKNLSDGI